MVLASTRPTRQRARGVRRRELLRLRRGNVAALLLRAPSAQWWALASRRMPDRTHLHEVAFHGLEDVVARAREEESTYLEERVRVSDAERLFSLEAPQRNGELVREQRTCSGAVVSPPTRRFVGPALALAARARLASSAPELAMTSAAGMPLPARNSSSEAASAAWRRARSSSSRSSSATAIRSTSAPSGRSVGSSSVSRPFFTRARTVIDMGPR